jgi:hypothetical protein
MTDLFEAIERGREHPEDYFGPITELQDQGWIAVFVRHRDSDHLENSNFDTILKEFSEKFELNEDYRVEGSRHWAVGWTDTMMVRAIECKCEDWEQADITAHPDLERTGLKLWRCHTCATDFGIDHIRNIFYRALEFKDRLDDYPVLDEEDFSRREYEELMEYLEQEVSSTVNSLSNDERIAEDWEPDNEAIFQYLFDSYSVCTVDDLSSGWVEDAVLTIADREGKKL